MCQKHHVMKKIEANPNSLRMSGIASFLGLHAQLLSLAVQKAGQGEGLDGFIT